jgi:hypothetical protein
MATFSDLILLQCSFHFIKEKVVSIGKDTSSALEPHTPVLYAFVFQIGSHAFAWVSLRP